MSHDVSEYIRNVHLFAEIEKVRITHLTIYMANLMFYESGMYGYQFGFHIEINFIWMSLNSLVLKSVIHRVYNK